MRGTRGTEQKEFPVEQNVVNSGTSPENSAEGTARSRAIRGARNRALQKLVGLASLVVLLLLLVFPAVHEPHALQGESPTLLLGIEIPHASDVSEEMRSQIRAGLRQDMVAALKPNSVVWKGALDGYMVAQELREEAKSGLQAELISDMKVALTRVAAQQGPSSEQVALESGEAASDTAAYLEGGIPTFVDDGNGTEYLSPTAAALMVTPQPLLLGVTP